MTQKVCLYVPVSVVGASALSADDTTRSGFIFVSDRSSRNANVRSFLRSFNSSQESVSTQNIKIRVHTIGAYKYCVLLNTEVRF